MKYKIYVAHSRDERLDYRRELYIPIMQRYERHDVIVPHGNGPYIDSEQLLPTCHLMIAEVSYPSTGLGMELIWARNAKTPVLCLHRTGTVPSSSITNKFSYFIQYTSEQDMLEKIDTWLTSNESELQAKQIEQSNLLPSSNEEIFSSHHATVDYIQEAKRRIDAADLTGEQSENLYMELDKAQAFHFGRFLLEHHGVNGEWSHQLFPWRFLSTQEVLPDGVVVKPKQDEFTNDLEKFIYIEAPVSVASQQRFMLFVGLIKKTLEEATGQIQVANFPCGWMSDLCLTLKFNEALQQKIEITGFDLDAENKDGVEQLLTQYRINTPFTFCQVDATKALGSSSAYSFSEDKVGCYDFVIGHGLSLYFPEKDCQNYFLLMAAMLKPGGTLLTSTMTPSTDWRSVDTALIERQRHFFFTVCNCRFSLFHSVDKVKNMLRTAGLEVAQVVPDDANMFPAIVATKPG